MDSNWDITDHFEVVNHRIFCDELTINAIRNHGQVFKSKRFYSFTDNGAIKTTPTWVLVPFEYKGKWYTTYGGEGESFIPVNMSVGWKMLEVKPKKKIGKNYKGEKTYGLNF